MSSSATVLCLTLFVTICELDIIKGQFGDWFDDRGDDSWRRSTGGWGGAQSSRSLNRWGGWGRGDDDNDDNNRNWGGMGGNAWRRNDNNDNNRPWNNNRGTSNWWNRRDDSDDDDDRRSWNSRGTNSWWNRDDSRDDNDDRRSWNTGRSSSNWWNRNDRDDDNDDRRRSRGMSWGRRGDDSDDDDDDRRRGWNSQSTNIWGRRNDNDDGNRRRGWNMQSPTNAWGRRGDDSDDDDDDRRRRWAGAGTRGFGNNPNTHNPFARNMAGTNMFNLLGIRQAHQPNVQVAPITRTTPVMSQRGANTNFVTRPPTNTWTRPSVPQARVTPARRPSAPQVIQSRPTVHSRTLPQRQANTNNVWRPTVAQRQQTIAPVRQQAFRPQQQNAGWGQNPLMAAWMMNEMF